MRVAIVHNEVDEKSSLDEIDVLEQVNGVAAALTKHGHEIEIITCSYDLDALCSRLEAFRPAAAFNLVESVGGHGRLIHIAPGVMDALKIPYTGSSAESLFVTSHKIILKQMLRAAALPTPDWIGPYPKGIPSVVRCGESVASGGASFIIKSVWEHASFNMGEDAIVSGLGAEEIERLLEKRAASLNGACFAERFIDGREFNVPILEGPEGPLLPVSEIVFENYPEGKPRIVDYNAKWAEDSFEYGNTPRRFDFPESEEGLIRNLKRLSLRCWDVFGIHGYARVDFRVDADGNPWILEVNANPCISPEAGFAYALEEAKLSYDMAVIRILNAALKPCAAKPPARIPRNIPSDHSGVPAKSARVSSSEITFRYTVRPEDRAAVAGMVEKSQLFTPDELGVAVELVDENLLKGDKVSGYYFVFAELSGRTVGYASLGPIPCTKTSWAIYWIVVEKELQGRAIGHAILEEAERMARSAGGTRIYVEASFRPRNDLTCSFYEYCGYSLTEVLNDFYAPGDARVSYLKVL